MPIELPKYSVYELVHWKSGKSPVLCPALQMLCSIRPVVVIDIYSQKNRELCSEIHKSIMSKISKRNTGWYLPAMNRFIKTENLDFDCKLCYLCHKTLTNTSLSLRNSSFFWEELNNTWQVLDFGSKFCQESISRCVVPTSWFAEF